MRLASSPKSESLLEELDRLLRKTQAEQRIPSASAAVFRGDDVIWTDAVGLADVESGEDVTPDHQYRIGSITKTFTAAAIMKLRDAGELDLEDRIGEHVEGPHARPTLRRMLAHLSGLQREPPGEVWELMSLPDREEFLASLDRAEQVLAPGLQWHYSNLAFALLGEVVSRRSGLPYEDYIRERFLEPLALSRTSWYGEPPVAKGYLVDPYSERVHPERYDVDLASSAAAGALWSTVGDLCKWGAFLADPDPEILTPETVEEMHAFQAMADLETWSLGWALGLALFRRGERILGGHTGGMPGHTAFLSYSRPDKVGSAVLLGTSSPSPEAQAAGLEMTVKAAEAYPAERDPWTPDESAPPDELDGVLGRWWAEGSEWVFSYREGKLRAQNAVVPGPRGLATFEREDSNRYRSAKGAERGELLRIVRDEEGRAVKLYWATYPFTREPKAFGT